MIKDNSFGNIAAEKFSIGDIVEWSKWNHEKNDWDMNYGIITNVKNEIRSNRLVSICKVIPLMEGISELEFFTLSLRLVSPTKREELEHEVKN